MNPPRLRELEQAGLWPDFHSKFINYWQESLADILPDNYEARVGERVNLYEYSQPTQRFGPDVAILRENDSFGPNPSTPQATLLSTVEPTVLEHVAIAEEIRQSYLEVIHRPNRELVSVLEVLSPSKKVEPGRSRYLAKRLDLLNEPVHLVELDLLHGGQRLPHRDQLPKADYYAIISRLEERFRCRVYAWTADQCLPRIPIPLRRPDPDVVIDLQSVYEITFTRGRYAKSLAV